MYTYIQVHVHDHMTYVYGSSILGVHPSSYTVYSRNIINNYRLLLVAECSRLCSAGVL